MIAVYPAFCTDKYTFQPAKLEKMNFSGLTWLLSITPRLLTHAAHLLCVREL